jgi:hypothetical protein
VGGGKGVWTTIINANMNKMKRIEGKGCKGLEDHKQDGKNRGCRYEV